LFNIKKIIKRKEKEKMKKTIFILIAMLLLLVTVGCFEVDEVKSIQFVNSPEASYFVGDSEEANQFELLIITDSTSIRYNLTSSEVVVQGLNGTLLDTREPRTKTVKVTYKTVTMTYTYEVLQKNITGWQQDVANAADLVEEAAGGYLIDNATELAIFAKMVNAGNTFASKTVTLNADIDLQNKPWTPIGTEPVKDTFHPFSGTFDGNDKKVSNVKIVYTASHDNCNAGLFGLVSSSVITDLKIDNLDLNITSSFKEEYSKNYAALVGRSTGAVTISNVEVTNATVRGNGRVGGILGMSNGLVNIAGCKVTANISAFNCVFLAGNDGEGDKVGGIAGQLQGENATIANVISNCTVNVFVNGTRDVGGVVGYAVSTASQIILF
jgi:hypothetical protein